MSLLSIVQTVADELGLKSPNSVVNSTDGAVRQMKALVLREGNQLASKYLWPQLVKEHFITLVDGHDSYELPIDFDRQMGDTTWDNANFWPLIGPISAQEWQARTKGVTAVTPRRKFRVTGAKLNQFFVFPTPSSSEAGQIISFEYISRNWIKPQDWASSISFPAGSFCYYNGNIYYTGSGGVSGATAPVHITGDASDDSITWTVQEVLYGDFAADTDESLIDEDIIEMGLRWRYLQAKGLEYQMILLEYNELVKRRASALKGAARLSLNGGNDRLPLLNYNSVPPKGYG